jgi:hypothetical protein
VAWRSDAESRAQARADTAESGRSAPRAASVADALADAVAGGRPMSNDPVTDQVPETYDVAGEPAIEAHDEPTLTSVLAGYEAAGFDAQFAATDDGQVHCFACGVSVSPSQVELHSLRRLEGASDPDDMLAVAAVTCRTCGVNGVLVLHYGPESSSGEADVLTGLEDRRTDAVLPAAQTPAEAGES